VRETSWSRAAILALVFVVAACDRAPRPPLAFTTDTLTIVGTEPALLPLQRSASGRSPKITGIRFSRHSAVAWHRTHLACRGDGDAKVMAWSGADSASLLVRCRVAAYVSMVPHWGLFTGDPARTMRFWARLYSGDSVLVAPLAITTNDSGIVRVVEAALEPRGVGRARLLIELPGKTLRTFVEVRERVADETLALAAGEFRTWRLSHGRYEIWMKAMESAPNSAWLDITTDGARCMRDSRDADTIHCFVRDSGALAIRHLGAPDPRTKRLGVRVVRNP
jgi:hypothetical protein